MKIEQLTLLEGNLCILELTEKMTSNMDVLADDLERYFSFDERTVFLPLRSLIPTRARKKGIVNANIKMLEAYKGNREQRRPLNVLRIGNSECLIKDGNSTFFNAVYSRWKILPCIVESANKVYL